MGRENTLFILGAGSSHEAGLPVGAELKTKIASLLNFNFEHGFQMTSGDDKIVDVFRSTVRDETPPPASQDINPYIYASWRIRDAMPQAISIDNFLDSHSGEKRIELAGKLAIVRSILNAEKRSKMYIDYQAGRDKLNLSGLTETWFNSFFQLLTENSNPERLVNRLKTVTIINFNYDRCVEHFLYYSLQNYYGINADEAAEIMQHLVVYHPYGTVGSLPWQKTALPMQFGGSPNITQLRSLASSIKTFTEGTDPASSSIAAIREKMRDFDLLVCLGFAFHRLNLELLRPAKSHAGVRQNKMIYATGKGISPSDCKVVEGELVDLVGSQLSVVSVAPGVTCRGLFDTNWRRLGFS